MALSQAEIQLLIRAKSEADQAFRKLSDQIKGVTGEADKSTTGLEKTGAAANKAGAGAQAAGVAFGLLAERLGRGLVSSFQETIQAANQLDAGMIGLSSVATAFKQDAGAAQRAAQSLAADGLLSLGDASTALKNLLAAGFGLPEATTLVERFKDSAAFGRQSALGFGQAITSATEGIKNGNSILVDNAGVTKNLSQMLVEAGHSAQDLSKASSDATIRQAIFNGIVKETIPQLGDAGRYLETAAGQQAKFNQEVTTAQQQIGKALQPALGSLLETMTPLVKVIGENAGALVPFATAIAAIVGPIAAMRAAAALGIPTLGDLGNKAIGMADSFIDAYGKVGTVRGGLAEMSTQAGFTVRDLGLLKSAALVAGAAFVGWELGRTIAELTGLDEKVANLTGSLDALAAQTAGAKQDVLNRAFANGAPLVLSYAGAIAYNNQVQIAHTAATDGSTGAMRRKLEAQLAIGEITRAQFDEQIKAVQAEERHAAAIRNSAGLRDALAGADKKYRDEIANTGLTLGQLQAAIKQNDDAFDAWAKQVGLSDTTVAKLKDSIKDGEKATKDHAKAAREAAEEHKKLLEQLDKMGIVTAPVVNEKLRELEGQLQKAADVSTPALATAVRSLHEQFRELEARAKASGLAVDGIALVFDNAATRAGLLVEGVRTFGEFVPLQRAVTEANRVDTSAVRDAIKARDDLTAAYKAFGITAPEELRAAAEASRQHFETLRRSGTATTEQLKIAYQQMIDDQKAATGQLPSLWEREILPRIQRAIGGLSNDMARSLGDMLTGAESFKSGFVGIWDSIKSSLRKILDDILQYFIESFLKRMILAMAGQQSGFGQAFAGMFNGGGGTGGGGGIPWSSIFGSGGGAGAATAANGFGGAASSSAVAEAGLGLGSGAGAGAGGGAAGGAGAVIGGGLLAAGAGYGLGQLGERIFGGAGWKAGTFGAATGAGAGAAIGTFVLPGLGTAAGAIIGGLAGALAGAIGTSAGEKTNDLRDQFLQYFGGAGTGQGSGFNTLAAKLAGISADKGGGEGGGQLFRNLTKANDPKELEKAIRAIIAALEEQEKQQQETADTTEQTTDEQTKFIENATDAVVDLSARQSEWNTERERGRNGGVVDADALGTAFEEMTGQVEDARDRAKELGEGIDDAAQKDTDINHLERTFSSLRQEIERARQAAGDLGATLAGLPASPGFTGGGDGGGGDVPGAAGGVYANRPGLVLFGEGGQPEVGGPRSFFRDVFAGLGVGQGGAAAGGGGFVVVPMLLVQSGAGGAFDMSEINRHLVSTAGVSGNDFGLREVLEGLARRVARQEIARRGT